MKTNDLRPWTGHSITKVTMDRILDHRPQIVEIVPLRDDAVPEGRGHIATINLVFPHLEDDLAHE
jgi:hypothetical protein